MEAMARIFEYGAWFHKRSSGNDDEEAFVDDMGYILGGIDPWGRARGGGQVVDFGDSGFKAQYRDGTNQVQHFVGAMAAGRTGGRAVATIVMDVRELVTEGGNTADMALNQIGGAIGAGLDGIGVGLEDIGQVVREEVGDPTQVPRLFPGQRVTPR